MSKKTTGTDVGYRAYFAAFAVMLVIVIAAVCVLSGCLDEMIFKAQTPTGGSNQTEIENNPPETPSIVDTSDVSDEPDTPVLPEESEPPFADTEAESEPAESEKETEKEAEEEDTTKAPETTTREEDTEKTPEVNTTVTTAVEENPPEKVETTTEEDTTEESYDRDEVFTEQDDNILYSYEDGGLVITGYDNFTTKLTIANKLDGVEVRAIGSKAFDGLGSLVEVRISAGVKTIGSKAFANCSVLNYVFIPSSVKDIASNAFEGSTNVVIYGVKGSYAEHFASDNGFEFKEQ